MARIVNKKRRKLKKEFVFITVFLLAYFGVVLFTNTLNTNLTMKIQKINEEIELITKENKTLNYEIQNLENKYRVYEIAQTADMGQINDNIISVFNEQ